MITLRALDYVQQLLGFPSTSLDLPRPSKWVCRVVVLTLPVSFPLLWLVQAPLIVLAVFEMSIHATAIYIRRMWR